MRAVLTLADVSAIATMALALTCAAPLAGCAASEIEPRSAATAQGDAWDPFQPDLARLAPPAMREDGMRDGAAPVTPVIMEAYPAPTRERPRSISLGFVGDQ